MIHVDAEYTEENNVRMLYLHVSHPKAEWYDLEQYAFVLDLDGIWKEIPF